MSRFHATTLAVRTETPHHVSTAGPAQGPTGRKSCSDCSCWGVVRNAAGTRAGRRALPGGAGEMPRDCRTKQPLTVSLSEAALQPRRTGLVKVSEKI